MEITRQALYEALWSSPRKELSSAWDINQNAITSISKRQNIPLPKPGHWTLVSMGKPPSQPALPGDPDVTVALEDKIRKPRKQKAASEEPKTSTQKPQTSGLIASLRNESSGMLTDSATPISEALPIVRKAFKTYSSPKAARDHKYQHVLPGSADVIRIAVMPEMVERALLLMDTVLREFQKLQWKIQTPSQRVRNRNSVFVDGVEVLFRITEHRRQERVRSESRWREWEYRYHSTGTLRFQFETGSWMQQEVKDNKRKKLEAQIPDIIAGILGEVERVKKSETDRRNREHTERLERRLSGLVQKALDYNRKCEKNLERQLALHEEAVRIRKFADAMNQHRDKSSIPERAHWLMWLKKKADSVDPALNQPSLNFSTPEDVFTQVIEFIESDLGAHEQLKELDLESAIERSLRQLKSDQTNGYNQTLRSPW